MSTFFPVGNNFGFVEWSVDHRIYCAWRVKIFFFFYQLDPGQWWFLAHYRKCMDNLILISQNKFKAIIISTFFCFHRDTTVQTLTLQPTVQDGIIMYEDSPLVCLCIFALNTVFVFILLHIMYPSNIMSYWYTGVWSVPLCSHGCNFIFVKFTNRWRRWKMAIF